MEKETIKNKLSFANLLFILVVVLSYMALWCSTVYSRYKNAELYALYQVSFNQVTTIEPVIASQILLVITFALIFLILLLNFKNMIKNKRLVFYLMMILCCPYLILKADEPIKYITSISNGSVQLAPFTLIGISLFFYAYNPYNWNSIIKSIKVLTFVVLLSACYGIAQYYSFFHSYGTVNRVVGLKWLWTPAITLHLIIVYWLSWSFKKKNKISKLFVTILIIFQYLIGILTDTRLILLITTLSLILFFYKIGKIKKTLLFLITIFFVALIVIVSTISKEGILLPETNMMNAVINGFLQRFSVNTRNSDLMDFFNFVSNNFFSFFPLGSGYTMDRNFIVDSGILNTFFMTGVVMFSLAVALLILPPLKLSRFKLSNEDIWIWVMAIIWIVRFFTSSTMVFNTEFLLFIIAAGRCAWVYDEKRKNLKFLRQDKQFRKVSYSSS